MNATAKTIEMVPATTGDAPATPTSVVIMPETARDVTPLSLLSQALSRGADMATLEKFMDLQERHERNQARKAFDDAIASAKAEIPVIIKNREVDFTSTKGRTHYRHEDLAGIARIVDPILGKFGLSYRFRTTAEPNAPVTVTCIVSHRDGHSEENTLAAGRDDTGNKNSIQQIGSTITYLQRYTLKAALGLAAAHDDDARSAEPTGTISEEQVAELRGLIVRAAPDLPKFLDNFGISDLAELPVLRLSEATMILNMKIKADEKKAKGKDGAPA